MAEGWIKLHRALLDHPIFTCSTPEQIKILLTILMMVNHKPNKWVFEGEKYEVKAGEMITSLDSIHKKCGKGISIKNIRTALKKFENLDFLANKSAKTGRLISIVNWEAYQVDRQTGGKEDGKQVANDGQTGGKQVATNKKDKNDNTVKNDENKKGTKPPEEENFVFTAATLKVISEKGFTEEQARAELSKCFDHFRGKGEMKKDWQATFRNWMRKDWVISPQTTTGTIAQLKV